MLVIVRTCESPTMPTCVRSVPDVERATSLDDDAVGVMRFWPSLRRTHCGPLLALGPSLVANRSMTRRWPFCRRSRELRATRNEPQSAGLRREAAEATINALARDRVAGTSRGRVLNRSYVVNATQTQMHEIHRAEMRLHDIHVRNPL